MQKFIKRSIAAVLFISITISLSAQKKDDTEFQKGLLLLLKINTGAVTNFGAAPDLYAGGISLNPQIAIVEHLLRVGANAGLAYTGKKFSGLFGPMAALKIKNFNLSSIAGLANLQLIGEANWGTNKQQMAGGGIGLEVLQKAQVIFTAQRDYNLNNWWLQVHIGVKLNKKKFPEDEFNKR
ncbi:MAG: hypothetical protein M3015_13020 [Bacteroidota bacterium]|nr:hypothetical protein [Bacteroidota bacterium]